MVQYFVTELDLQSITDPSNLAVPERFSRSIDAWTKKRKGKVYSLNLAIRQAPGWTELGCFLIRLFRSKSKMFSLYADGSVSVRVGVKWLEAVAATSVPHRVSIFFQNFHHPNVKLPILQNLTWCSLGDWSDSSFPMEIWEDLGSESFNQGCDLIMSFSSSSDRSREVVSEEIFFRDFESAEGWMIPLDGNIGFVVGVSGLLGDCSFTLES